MDALTLLSRPFELGCCTGMECGGGRHIYYGSMIGSRLHNINIVIYRMPQDNGWGGGGDQIIGVCRISICLPASTVCTVGANSSSHALV
jgi:hypothetical protein